MITCNGDDGGDGNNDGDVGNDGNGSNGKLDLGTLPTFFWTFLFRYPYNQFKKIITYWLRLTAMMAMVAMKVMAMKLMAMVMAILALMAMATWLVGSLKRWAAAQTGEQPVSSTYHQLSYLSLLAYLQI